MVFISHAKEDREIAKKLFEFLESKNYDPWLDKEKLLPGQKWEIVLLSALKKADYIILVFSNTSVEKRGYVQKEFNLALKYCEEKLDSDIFIIPCKIDDCEIPEKFQDFQWVDLNEPDSFEKILESLNLQRDKQKGEQKPRKTKRNETVLPIIRKSQHKNDERLEKERQEKKPAEKDKYGEEANNGDRPAYKKWWLFGGILLVIMFLWWLFSKTPTKNGEVSVKPTIEMIDDNNPADTEKENQASSTSNEQTVPVITINTQPKATTDVTEGVITGSLMVSASVTQGATPSYQWYSATTNSNSGGTAVSGATSASFSIPATLTAGGNYYYYCVVSGSGGATSVTSNVAKVTVNAPDPVITINTQPTNATVTQGSIAGTLSVAASVTQNATLSYQWYSNSMNSNTGGASLGSTGNARTNTLTIPATLTAGGNYYYYCVVSGSGGATSVTSNVVRVTVNAPVPVITINTHPTNATVTQGSIAGSLSVAASVTQSATLSYQWYSATTNSNSGGAAVSGATSANFIIPATLAAGTYYYFCEVLATGGTTSVRSNMATVDVQQAAANVIKEQSWSEKYNMVEVVFDRTSPAYTNIRSEVTSRKNLSRNFYIGKYQMTQKEWKEIMGNNFIGDRLPVVRVTWYDCIVFCNKLSEKYGLKKYYNITGTNEVTCNTDANGFRLPTEAEWEYAARGGIHTKNYEWAGCNTEQDLKFYAWYSENSDSKTHPVGEKKTNELGLYDMSGNVWEWCEDLYGGSGRVIRGGGWRDGARYARVSGRGNYGAPGYSSIGIGFRLASSSK